MGRPPIGKVAMTSAERVARWREKHGIVTKPAGPDHAALVKALAAARARIAELEASTGAEHFTDKTKLRLDDAIRIHKARLDKQFKQRVYAEVRRRIDAADDATRASNKELRQKVFDLESMLGRRAVFTETQYREMLMLCHPDSSASAVTKARLLQVLVEKKKALAKPSISWPKVEAAIKDYTADKTTVTFTNVWKAVEKAVPGISEVGDTVSPYIRGCLGSLGFTANKSGMMWARPTSAA